MVNDPILRPVRATFFKVVWPLCVAPLALSLNLLLFDKIESPPAWENRHWFAALFLLPSVFWLACWLKSKHYALLVFGASLLGFGVVAPLFYFVSQAVWIDHQLLTLPSSEHRFDGSALGLFAIAGLSECIRYSVLLYALNFKERASQKSVFLTCTSLAIGAAAGGLFCKMAFENTALFSPVVLGDFAHLFSKELAISSLWFVCITRRDALSPLPRFPLLIDFIWFALLIFAQALLSGWFQISTGIVLPVIFCTLVALWGHFSVFKSPLSKNAPTLFNIKILALICSLIAITLIVYRLFSSPQKALLSVKGLTFDYPAHWINLNPKGAESPPSSPFGITQKTDHFEIVSPSDRASRIEIRVADKYEGAMLRSSLHMHRASRFGDHQWILSESNFDHGGRDWHRTHFSYPYHYQLGSPAQILHGIEYAIVDGNHLYVVTLHSRQGQTKSLDAIVSSSLQSSAVE